MTKALALELPVQRLFTMKAPALILSSLVACVAALCGCSDEPSQTKEIVAFSFHARNSAQLTSDVVATIAGSSISATVPFGTDVTGLIATFETTGAAVAVAGAAQASDVTRNNFSGAVTYRVSAEDATTRDYVVRVTIASRTEKEITTYRLLKGKNPGLGADVTATINGTAIAATVPFGTAVTTLIATFSSTGTAVTVEGTAQVSDTTVNNFISPMIYRVTAGDGSTKDHTVTVTVAPPSAKEITSYKFLSVNNPALEADVDATITDLAIAANVPFGTDVTALVAAFEKTGANVTVAGIGQLSRTTPNDFTSPVAYTAIAANGDTDVYTVTVTVDRSSEEEITDHEIGEQPQGIAATGSWRTFPETCIASRCANHGNLIRLWQSVLWADGRFTDKTEIDGDFGPATEGFTKSWQRSFLPSDGETGEVGPNTWGAAELQRLKLDVNGDICQNGSFRYIYRGSAGRTFRVTRSCITDVWRFVNPRTGLLTDTSFDF